MVLCNPAIFWTVEDAGPYSLKFKNTYTRQGITLLYAVGAIELQAVLESPAGAPPLAACAPLPWVIINRSINPNVTIQLYVKLGFICLYVFLYFSFSSERKVPKEAPPKEETKVSPFGNPLPFMVRYGV